MTPKGTTMLKSLKRWLDPEQIARERAIDWRSPVGSNLLDEFATRLSTVDGVAYVHLWHIGIDARLHIGQSGYWILQDSDVQALLNVLQTPNAYRLFESKSLRTFLYVAKTNQTAEMTFSGREGHTTATLDTEGVATLISELKRLPLSEKSD